MNRFGGFRPRRLGEDAVSDRIAADQRKRVILAALGGALLTFVLALVWYLDTDLAYGVKVQALEEENQRLGAALSVGRLDLEMERATRAELERQLVELNDSLKKRQAELAFLKSRTASKPR
ncbi:MAG: hypothetical protein CVU19_06045 [Betaproteobacteria bacterium HGW-Betaproteobacteria-13]|uniref:Uncharacterized protein n=1 Tax=Parazoarcus communis TaxID=41977 RepID=A0A2U8H5P5_9RHOO|nr:hypothetical protein [Parazoarcus communis]AWI81262.1 hypothetical protein CEW87_18960 [Parazoarcus communis]PKO57867.1 MAG: hypothetical protein CVU25_06515 [Betaproteobacteria bacterium HGW-Betaproteobacteria-19]PKO81612.1 MAG: hypothetical protein CVU19_06045 [Betaproteobacteria bacterium HGW-Betaproteobacteria-13]